MEYEYFTWLVDFIDPDHLIGEDYQPVIVKLFFTNFRWKKGFIDDRNRAADGLEFRREFVREFYYGEVNERFFVRPCSCLEMLIALTKRIEDGISSVTTKENMAKWFWIFMVNLGLDPDDSRVYDSEYVENVIEKWLDREYDPTENGNIFTSFSREIDFRKEPIAVQMNVFLNENLKI